jgi:cytoplasmic iron level regulating protein YaaA (DUF328/UPF0246 family)
VSLTLLLPPSETKRDGGEPGTVLDLETLSFPSLAPQRRTAIAALRRLSRSVADSTRALGLGPTQRFEIDRNRALLSSPTMPAMDRFTGVLFEELDAPSLDSAARDWLTRNVIIQSALLGPIGAADAVPAYRLSASSRLPGLPLVRHWSSAGAAALSERDGVILDVRSEAYAALAPLDPGPTRRYVRVVTEGTGGRRTALNHFNKKGKGAFTRAVALARPEVESVADLIAWAEAAGIRCEESTVQGELDLLV